MLSINNAPAIVCVEKTTTGKSLVAKFIGLFAHLGVLYTGTLIAEHAWRLWAAC